MTTTATVPGLRQVGVNGVGFMVDDRPGRGVQRRSVPFLRNQADTGVEAGAQSLNPAGVWRRSQEDWSHGAGQSHRDRAESDPARFRSSKGVYVWDRWKLSLLSEVENKRASAATERTGLVACDSYLFVSDGTGVARTDSILSSTPTWTGISPHAGESPANIQGMATDGDVVYMAFPINGIHVNQPPAIPSDHYNDLQATSIYFVGGRLMAVLLGAIYNVTTSGAAPAALYTHPLGSAWRWSAFAEGPTHIYAAGFSSDRSDVYKITIQADGTALAAPSKALPTMPPGEAVVDMLGYSGFIVMATTRGIRLASIGSDGNLTLGGLIPVRVSSRVRTTQLLAGNDRFVYFPWESYDGTSEGLGRLDLSVFTAPLTPAYATDVMAPLGAGILASLLFTDLPGNQRIVFIVGGAGVFAPSANKVASGTLDTGDISYGITDDKIATQLDVSHETLQGSHQAFVSVNGGTFTSLGTHTEGGTEGPFAINESRGERFEVRHTLTRNTALTGGPTLSRTTLSAYPVPRRPSEVFVVWLLLHTAESLNNGNTASRDPHSLLNDIIALEEAGTVIDFQLGAQTYRALIEDHQFVSEGHPDGAWPQGSVELTVRAI